MKLGLRAIFASAPLLTVALMAPLLVMNPQADDIAGRFSPLQPGIKQQSSK